MCSYSLLSRTFYLISHGKINILCSDYLRQDVHVFGIVNCMLDICGLQALNRL